MTLCALHVLKSCCGTASQMPAQCQPSPMPAYRRPLRSFCFAFFSGAENKLKSENVSFLFFCALLHLLRPLLLAFSSIRSQARVRFSFQFLPSSSPSSSCWLSLSLLSLVLFHTARATLTMSEDDEKSAIYKRCSWTQAEEKCR